MLSALKDLAKQLPYPILLRAYYLWYIARDVRAIEAARRRAGVPRLNEVDLHTYTRSDTLFVLGSGASINDISPERWKAIARHDSVGFNFWPIHPFVPTYYFIEIITREDAPEAFDHMVGLMNERAPAYREVPKVAMELWKRGDLSLDHFSPEFRHNLYAAYNLPIPARTETELSEALRYLGGKGWLRPERRFSTLLKYTASLTTMLIFAAKLGYERVVLCGTDLRHSRYFYHDANRYPAWAEFNRPTGDETVHATDIDIPWHVPVSRAVQVIDREVLKPAGISLFVENTDSALYPAIPAAGPELFA